MTAPAGSGPAIRIEPAPRVLSRLARDLRPHRNAGAAACAALVVSTLATVAVPWTVRYGIDHGVTDADRAALLGAVLVGVGAVLVAAVGQGVAVDLIARVGEQYLYELRVRLVSHTLAQPLELYEAENTGRLVSRLTSDVESVQELLMNGLTMFVQSALVLVFALGSLFAMSWELALVSLAVLPPVLVATVWFRGRAAAAYDGVREAIAAVLAQLQENLAGIREVQAHARRRDRVELFAAVNEAHYDRNIHAARISSIFFPAVEYVGVAALAVVLGYGGWRAITGGADSTVTIGTITAFLLLVGNVFDPIQHLSQLYNVVLSAVAALRRVYGLLDLDVKEVVSGAVRPPMGDTANGPDPQPVGGGGGQAGGGARVELRDVSYRYRSGTVDAVRDVSLTLARGERLALVGATGAGKSTLAKLLVGFHDPTAGCVVIDGEDLGSIPPARLRSKVLLVPQEGHVFAGSLADNIGFARPDADMAALVGAAEVTGLDAVAANLPDGYGTILGRGGATLSAGQRQLVGLSRIMLADPALLVLDEATSALDPATELQLERALAAVMQSRTTVIIVHRLTTAARCDRIGVLRGGRIVELDSHAELLAAGGVYASLWASWRQTEQTTPD
ncbi:MAG: ABC transporter ATP-binding protein [Acidimicrobiia bacterium]|nr:ABC transporter ATP-binding protein [Acidimicrobiia bacterium]